MYILMADLGDRTPELPRDGYEWRKYGQKFIRNIGKFRSYYKCQKAHCTAKKRADWSPSEPGDLRIVYEGDHSHGAAPDQTSQAGGSDSNNPNRYNLLTQMFGDRVPPS